MRSNWQHVRDGLVTGVVLALLITLPCPLLGSDLPSCGEWIFVIGTGMAFLSGVWTIAGYHSPPGLIGLLKEDVEVYPSASKDSLWLDRFISPRNVWLIAGATMVLISFLPPYLGV